MLPFINMEPQINEAQNVLASLKKVTPLSKYLAMVFFIILPFLGGWIGYTYAPEKIVVHEVVVSPAKESLSSDASEMKGLSAMEIEEATSLTEEEVNKRTNEAIQGYLNQRPRDQARSSRPMASEGTNSGRP